MVEKARLPDWKTPQPPVTPTTTTTMGILTPLYNRVYSLFMPQFSLIHSVSTQPCAREATNVPG
jgi:hypothetical protein